MAPVKGEHEEIVSIEGTLLMLDGRTPHVGVVVQAIATGQDKTYIASTALSDSRGRYRFISLKPGKYQVRCYIPDGYIYYSEEASLEVETGITPSNIDLRFPPFKKGVWRHYGPLDGLAHNTAPPKVRIVSITTDQTYRLKKQDAKRKTESPSIPAFTTGTRVTIEYNSVDLKTVPEKRQYRCRIYETGDMRRETSDMRHQTPDSRPGISDPEVEFQVSSL